MLLNIFRTKITLIIVLIVASLSTSAQSAADSTVKQKQEKKVSYTALPKLSFDPSRGTSFGAMGMAFFKIDNAPDTKPSRVVVTGGYSTKKDWMAMAFSQLFLNNDKLRLTIAGGYMNSNFQTYETSPVGSEFVIPYNNHGWMALFTPSFEIYKHLYLGPSVQLYHSTIDFDLSAISYPDSLQSSNLNSAGVTLNYDSRKDVYNSSNGINAMLRYYNYGKWFGNDVNSNKLMIIGNYYYPINTKMVLASRVFANIGLGNVPFVLQGYVGNTDLRGYTKGEYRGDQIYSAQVEYRWNFYKKWGMVGFTGLALAVTSGDASPALPDVGAGLRYKVIPKYNINLGVDAAVGRDDWGLYFRITEAF